MSRTPKPLVIVALPPCDGWEELVKLEKQGHTIIRANHDLDDFTWSALLNADIVLGPNCWRMTNAHKTYLTLAIKEARMLKYDTYEKRADSKTRASVTADLDVSDDKPSSSD